MTGPLHLDYRIFSPTRIFGATQRLREWITHYAKSSESIRLWTGVHLQQMNLHPS